MLAGIRKVWKKAVLVVRDINLLLILKDGESNFKEG